ncbi:CBS domain-containing protein [Streptomyces atrovirens]|uniref:CBS domain-containing protein n=1 Tax=Streptomyces atrovirens TaxID=285556 RepID=A0ABW0DTE3_9ACTN
MMHHKVGSVMTTDVVRAEYGTPFKEVVRLLAEHVVSGLAVVDEDDKVIGVISETDLLERQAATPGPYAPRRRLAFLTRLTRGARRQAAKARARTAGQLMTRPPVTAHADDTVVEAARTMVRQQVERLPVLDEADRLVGMVTRRDLLQVLLRSDAEIRTEVIEDVLVRTLWLPSRSIDVSVMEGVVTLTGHMERKSEKDMVRAVTGRIDGVVGVVDHLTYRLDDVRPYGNEPQALHGVSDDWLRRL